MRRCVIIGGAAIGDYEVVGKYLRKDDFFIFCDSGLVHLTALSDFGVSPNLIVGDFDSHENPHLKAETIVLPCEKDDTDTVFAVKEALKRGFEDFLLIGVVGGRLDHTLGNVSILLMLDKAGKTGKIVDDYSEMEIVSGKTALPGKAAMSGKTAVSGNAALPGKAAMSGKTAVSGNAALPGKAVLVDDSFAYFSLLNISGEAKGINVKNAKYPLHDACIECEYQYGISNEVTPGKTAEIFLKEGKLLLIKVRRG